MTGLVGMTVGVGAFCLAASLGNAKQFIGSWAFGFGILATLALLAWRGIARCWRQDAAMPSTASLQQL